MTLTATAPVTLRPDRRMSSPPVARRPTVRLAAQRAAAVPCAGAQAYVLPVTTVRQGARVAMHRTRRCTVLGRLPVVGPLVVPWLWPLHMVIVGLTAGHIRHTPDASLSYCDGTRPRRHFLIS